MVNSTVTPVASPVNERNRLLAEHAVLVWLQYEALQKSPYLRMSVKEAEAYDRRRLRLREVDERLAAREAEVNGPNAESPRSEEAKVASLRRVD
jgi:hypothetical protein